MNRLPSVRLDTARDRLSVWSAGRDHRGAASAATTGDQELVASWKVRRDRDCLRARSGHQIQARVRD